MTNVNSVKITKAARIAVNEINLTGNVRAAARAIAKSDLKLNMVECNLLDNCLLYGNDAEIIKEKLIALVVDHSGTVLDSYDAREANILYKLHAFTNQSGRTEFVISRNGRSEYTMFDSKQAKEKFNYIVAMLKEIGY